jgi:hypothetical protein
MKKDASLTRKPERLTNENIAGSIVKNGVRLKKDPTFSQTKNKGPMNKGKDLDE